MRAFEIDSQALRDRQVARNQLAFAFLSYMPIVPGHLLICPIRPVEFCELLSVDEWRAIFELKQQVCRALERAFEATGFNFAWNSGSEAGQSVPHFHLHVVPRKAGDAGIYRYEPREFLYRPGTRAVSPPDELRQTAQLVRSCLE